jgi:hypothetical protein
MTYDYVRVATSHNLPVNRVQGEDLTRFPIEKARFRSMPVMLLFSGALTCAYGWVLEKGVVGPSPDPRFKSALLNFGSISQYHSSSNFS